MTINELLRQSGVKFYRQDATNLGRLVMDAAKKKEVRWQKKEELIRVNDFPESFTEDMQKIAIDYFSSKSKAK